MKEHEILSMKNCHRAATVQQIAHPEYGVWKFEWRGQKLSRNAFLRNMRISHQNPVSGTPPSFPIMTTT